MLKIDQAETEEQFQQVRELMAEYIAWDAEQTAKLGLDAQTFLDFYHGAEEEKLPGKFTPPAGCLLLATYDGKAAGCGAFQPIDDQSCEMKRMYVRPEFRGKSIGKKMADMLIATAKTSGYKTMRLETVSFMQGAHALYASLGFSPCDPYYAIPPIFREITSFMELELAK